MRMTMLTAMLALVLGAGACRSAKKPTTQLNAAESVRQYEWRGALSTPSELAGAMQVRGTGTWAREGENASHATVTISNATPGGIHPWHVHRGRCGDNGPIVGDAAAYKPLAVDGNGNASSTARLKVTLPDSGTYYVNVHALATNMGMIISCGNLAPPVS
jgi:hypothetical protein